MKRYQSLSPELEPKRAKIKDVRRVLVSEGRSSIQAPQTRSNETCQWRSDRSMRRPRTSQFEVRSRKAKTSSRKPCSKKKFGIESRQGRTPSCNRHVRRPTGDGSSASASFKDITIEKGCEARGNQRSIARDIHNSNEMSSIVSVSDFPPEGVLIPLPSSPASSCRYGKNNDFLEVDNILRRDVKRIIIEAPTGSGKSRKCPNITINYMEQTRYRKPLLVLSSATIDVVSMQKACAYRSMYKLGGRRHSNEPSSCQCVYASMGLATRWFATEGIWCFRKWGGVLFDELHEAETDMEYSLLWEAACRHSRDYADEHFLVIGASATLSACMRDRLRGYDVTFNSVRSQAIQCRHVQAAGA